MEQLYSKVYVCIYVKMSVNIKVCTFSLFCALSSGLMEQPSHLFNQFIINVTSRARTACTHSRTQTSIYIYVIVVIIIVVIIKDTFEP